MTEALSMDDRLLALREAGAAQLDAVGWHYIEALAERSRAQAGTARVLLQDKLDKVLDEFGARLELARHQRDALVMPIAITPSPMAVLLAEMAPPAAAPSAPNKRTSPHTESPRVHQFRQQLRRISVQKQVSRAIAQAPQNAGPINSHMLVLRALGMMRDLSPDYLNRFMAYVDTLLCLEETERAKLHSKKPSAASKAKR